MVDGDDLAVGLAHAREADVSGAEPRRGSMAAVALVVLMALFLPQTAARREFLATAVGRTRRSYTGRQPRAKCCGGTGAFQALRAGSIPVARFMPRWGRVRAATRCSA